MSLVSIVMTGLIELQDHEVPNYETAAVGNSGNDFMTPTS